MEELADVCRLEILRMCVGLGERENRKPKERKNERIIPNTLQNHFKYTLKNHFKCTLSYLHLTNLCSQSHQNTLLLHVLYCYHGDKTYSDAYMFCHQSEDDK